MTECQKMENYLYIWAKARMRPGQRIHFLWKGDPKPWWWAWEVIEMKWGRRQKVFWCRHIHNGSTRMFVDPI